MNGVKLKELRESRGYLQKELAAELKIASSTIGMYEQGRREPDNVTLKNIANYFDVSTDYLLDNERIDTNRDIAIRERAVLKKFLVEAGYMLKDETLSDDEIERIMNFIVNNKDFLKAVKM